MLHEDQYTVVPKTTASYTKVAKPTATYTSVPKPYVYILSIRAEDNTYLMCEDGTNYVGAENYS